jgi:hypothetical protein
MSCNKTYTGFITELPDNGIFVYGANTDGIHGAGAAKTARQYFGALYGKVGFCGKSYGIVTKDLKAKNHPSVSREEIVRQIGELYQFARLSKPDYEFYIAYSGTGQNLNHYTNEEMAEMFSAFDIPTNIVFEQDFARLVEEKNVARRFELS